MVRPLVNLLALDCSLLQNFEALMALTNLAGISDRLRLVQSIYMKAPAGHESCNHGLKDVILNVAERKRLDLFWFTDKSLSRRKLCLK